MVRDWILNGQRCLSLIIQKSSKSSKIVRKTQVFAKTSSNTNKAKTPKYKKRLSIYDKTKELDKATNKEFLRMLRDEQGLLDQLKDKTRFELNIVTKEQIRKLLNIQDNKLRSVLHSDANPILTVFDEAINLNGTTINHTNKKDYMMELVIKDCDYVWRKWKPKSEA